MHGKHIKHESFVTKDTMGPEIVPYVIPWPQGYETFFMLISTEHELHHVHHVKMPTYVGILT